MPQESLKPHLSFLSSTWTNLSLVVGAAIALSGPFSLSGFAQTPTSPEQPDVFKTRPQPAPQSPAPTSTPNPQAPAAPQARFFCQWEGGQYKVMYNPESRPGEFFPWATPREMGGGWSSERRCLEISRRLEEYRPDGLLEMQTSTENGYNIVCATAQRNPSCRIIFTVPSGQNPTTTRDLVFQNLAIADRGQQTQEINTFADGDQGTNWLGQATQILSALGGQATTSTTSDAINLRPFLDPADGGTGTALTKVAPVRSNPRFNPDQFR